MEAQVSHRPQAFMVRTIRKIYGPNKVIVARVLLKDNANPRIPVIVRISDLCLLNSHVCKGFQAWYRSKPTTVTLYGAKK
jgi:hypothetical protein